MQIVRVPFQFKGTGPNVTEMTDFEEITQLGPGGYTGGVRGCVVRTVAFLEAAADQKVWVMLTHTGTRRENSDALLLYHHDPTWPSIAPDWYLPLPASGGVAHRACCRLTWGLDGGYSVLTCATLAAGVWVVSGEIALEVD